LEIAHFMVAPTIPVASPATKSTLLITTSTTLAVIAIIVVTTAIKFAFTSITAATTFAIATTEDSLVNVKYSVKTILSFQTSSLGYYSN